MKTPAWAIVIGICMMCFGSCSVLKNYNALQVPRTIELQKTMMNSVFSLNEGVIAKHNKEANNELKVMNKFNDQMNEMLSISEFAKVWMVRFAYIGIFLAVVYIFAGIFLVVIKNFSIPLAYGALSVSLVFSVVRFYVLNQDSSANLIVRSNSLGEVFGIIIDVVFLVLVLLMDKSAYKAEVQEETSSIV